MGTPDGCRGNAGGGGGGYDGEMLEDEELDRGSRTLGGAGFDDEGREAPPISDGTEPVYECCLAACDCGKSAGLGFDRWCWSSVEDASASRWFNAASAAPCVV